MSRRRCVAVTGASGYIGERLCRLLIEAGMDVRALARRDPGIEGAGFHSYDLRGDIPSNALMGVDVVIHAATETVRGADPDVDAELAGLHRLLAAADSAGASLIFISSQSAQPNAPTNYGRFKAEAEQVVLARHGCVVRPGQVYGGREKGLWGALAAVARGAVAIPRFIPEPQVQPIHVDDLARALAALAHTEHRASRIYALADPCPVPFSRFIQMIGLARFGRAPVAIPVPFAPLLRMLRLAGRLGLKSGLVSRLQSLNVLPRLESEADMSLLLGHFLRFPEGIADKRISNRALLREGRVLFRYAHNSAPAPMLLRHYVRAVSTLDRKEPLTLPRVTRMLPLSLLLFDQPAARNRSGPTDPLTQRIDLALLLGESSVEHTDAFMLAAALPRRVLQLVAAGTALFADGVARLIDLVAGSLLDRLRPRPATAPSCNAV